MPPLTLSDLRAVAHARPSNARQTLASGEINTELPSPAFVLRGTGRRSAGFPITHNPPATSRVAITVSRAQTRIARSADKERWRYDDRWAHGRPPSRRVEYDHFFSRSLRNRTRRRLGPVLRSHIPTIPRAQRRGVSARPAERRQHFACSDVVCTSAVSVYGSCLSVSEK
jgi:hypothetical protein